MPVGQRPCCCVRLSTADPGPPTSAVADPCPASARYRRTTRVAFGAAAPARGRDRCAPYPRNQSEMHRPNAPLETEQGSEWHPRPRSRASSTQHSPIARGHVGWGKPGLSTNPRQKVRTLAPTSGRRKRSQRGGWGNGSMAKPASELSLPPPSAGTPVRAIVETRFGRLRCALGGRSWPADPLRPDARSGVTSWYGWLGFRVRQPLRVRPTPSVSEVAGVGEQ